MKNFFLSLLLLFAISIAYGQNWHPLPHDTVFLKDTKGRTTTIQVLERQAGNNEETLLLAPSAGIRPGSLPTRIFQQLLDHKSVLSPYNPTLIGADIRVMDNGNAYLRDTSLGDSILVKTRAGLHDTWQFDAKKNTQAEVTLLSYDTLFGIIDSFKEITVSSNSLILKITLSKNEGIVATHNLFPQSGDTVYAYSHTDDPRLTHRQINDFEIGDVFHSVYAQDILYSGKNIDTIVSKTVSADSLTVTYGVKRLDERENSAPHRFVITRNTEDVSLNYSKNIIHKELPGILYLHTQSRSFWYFICYDSSRYFPKSYIRSFDDMFNNYSTGTSYTGAGRYSYRSLESESGDVYTRLVYYKKASDEWGTKVVIGTPPALQRNVLQLYPNPVSDLLVVQGLEVTQEASIYNALGQIERTLTLTNSPIDLSGLQNGTYYLRLESGQTYRFAKTSN